MYDLKCMLGTELEKAKLKGIDNVNPAELGEVIDMYKDLCEMEYWETKKMKYWLEICLMQEEMEEDSDHRYYRGQPRNNMEQYARGRRMYEPDYRMTPEMYRDMDKENMTDKEKRDMDKRMGRMYYTEPERMEMERKSKYGDSHDKYMMGKRMYTNTEPMHKQKRLEMLDEHLNDLVEMAKETVEDMSPEEKQLYKTKITKLMNM